ncbi:MAG: phosphatidylcholine synthase [Hyphomicrobiaceae bacterium]|nr:phosphatidylcholine synthase [Hyphomicrobiaceae bacterium]
MPAKVSAAAVHILTALGAVCGLFALTDAAAHDWRAAFLWLGAAAFIDAVDGPLARRIGVEKVLPQFSGATLDLIVDYLTYCVVPAFILMESGRVGPVAGGFIVLSSLFHFADQKSKTSDGFFVGFPAIWNVVCLYVFVFDAGPQIVIPIVFGLALATFVPLKWVHPVRSEFWRAPTLTAVALWSVAALYEVIAGFPGTLAVQVIFAVVGVYLVCVGVARTCFGRGKVG